MKVAVGRMGIRPGLGSLLLLLWVVVMGTAVSFPLFLPLRELLEPRVPPLAGIVLPYIASLVVSGGRVAGLVAQILAVPLGWEPAVPPAVAPWFIAARRIGETGGLVVAAALPAWLVVVWVRRGTVTRGGAPTRLRRLPLVIATVWTIVVAQPLATAVGRAAFPVETWLMLPAASGAPSETPAAPGWCAYHLHESAFACEAHRVTSHARRADSAVPGYSFAGARCVSAADVPRPGCSVGRIAADG